MRSHNLFPTTYPVKSIDGRLRAAFWFAAFAWPWAGILGACIGLGSYFVVGGYFWYTILVFSASTFAGAAVSHLILGGYRGFLRCAMSGGAAPGFATFFGAVLTGWGAWGSSAIREFATIGPLFTLPGAVYGTVYWLIHEAIRKKRSESLS